MYFFLNVEHWTCKLVRRASDSRSCLMDLNFMVFSILIYCFAALPKPPLLRNWPQGRDELMVWPSNPGGLEQSRAKPCVVWWRHRPPSARGQPTSTSPTPPAPLWPQTQDFGHRLPSIQLPPAMFYKMAGTHTWQKGRRGKGRERKLPAPARRVIGLLTFFTLLTTDYIGWRWLALLTLVSLADVAYIGLHFFIFADIG